MLVILAIYLIIALLIVGYISHSLSFRLTALSRLFLLGTALTWPVTLATFVYANRHEFTKSNWEKLKKIIADRKKG